MTGGIPEFAALAPVEPDQARALIEWARGGPLDPVRMLIESCGPPTWLLAHCDDGVTWGRLDGQRLALSSGQVPAWSTPAPGPDNLQQLRMFGKAAEILVWRDTNSSLMGRVLRDDPQRIPDGEPTRPRDETYLLSADRCCPGPDGRPSAEAFTAVADRTGRVQVVPFHLTDVDFEKGWHALGLDVRHYFEVVSETGCVRIAASRLVDVRRLPPSQHQTALGAPMDKECVNGPPPPETTVGREIFAGTVQLCAAPGHTSGAAARATRPCAVSNGTAQRPH